MPNSDSINRHARFSVRFMLVGIVSLALLSGFPELVSAAASAKAKKTVVAQAQQWKGGPQAGQQLIPVIPPGSAYKQANLVSDVPGIATLQDPLLVNPWGVAMLATSPFWIANDGTSTAVLYQGDIGVTPLSKNALNVALPGGPPTGAVSNGTTDFVITSGGTGPARFIFASITGNLVAWRAGTTGIIAASHAGSVYTGLAIGNNGVGNFLYAADFANGTIDVFDGTFVLQAGALFPFVDPTIPTVPGNTYHPHNIQNIGGLIYVTYAKVGVSGGPENGAGNGFVRRFNTNGVRDLTFGINNGPLDAPWGIAIAPASFGIFGGALLVGNFSDKGKINAFNPTTGAFLGTLQDEGGSPIQIDQLLALTFGNGVGGGDTGALYFAAGIGRQEHGLFGSLRPTTVSATALVQFSSTDYSVNETSGTINITVVRSGDTTGTSTVNYAPLLESSPGHASSSDFTLAPGTLTFAAGETSKTFVVGITNDVLAEGNETLKLVLSNPTGAGLAAPSIATLTIVDGGGTPPPAPPVIPPGSAYKQANLVSDVPGIATLQDPLLVNPWGVAMLATSPFWIANDGTSTAVLYQGDIGVTPLSKNALNVALPGGPPTGAVSNGTTDFVITSGGTGPARFIFASITGNLVAWRAGTTGIIAASHAGSVYTGLAIGNNGVGNFLYAADFANGTIDVFDGTFVLQAGALFPFVDPTIPTVPGNTYHPHNIQNIGGLIYVTYAKVGVSGGPENGAGNGFVRRFNTNGVRDLTFGINNGPLDAPWGIAIAPASFGIFGGALLVGNFSDKGKINAFNPTTGAFLGTLQDEGGSPIQIDQLLALTFGNGVGGGDTGALYFAAGIGRQEHGLFGSLRPTTVSATALVQFSSTDYSVNETSGTINITVVRSGDTTGTSTVNYAPLLESSPGHASSSDFTLAPGTLTFAAGETSKTFVVGITNDVLAEGNETLKLVLSNPTGAGLAAPGIATLTIVDNGTGTANVSISKIGPSSVVPGATFTYTLTVANAGPDAATNVTTTDVLPAGVTFISATPSQGTCSGTTTVTCVLGTLASGGTATIVLTVSAPAFPATISNTASVTSAQSDPGVANNSSTALVFAAVPTQVPTLSAWALLLLAAMLAGVGMTLRRK